MKYADTQSYAGTSKPDSSSPKSAPTSHQPRGAKPECSWHLSYLSRLNLWNVDDRSYSNEELLNTVGVSGAGAARRPAVPIASAALCFVLHWFTAVPWETSTAACGRRSQLARRDRELSAVSTTRYAGGAGQTVRTVLMPLALTDAGQW